MRLKAPPNVKFHGDTRLLVWKPLGVVDEAVVNKILSFLGDQEATSRNPFDRFTDTSEQGPVKLTFKYVFHVALYRRLTYAGRPPVKSAFFVTDPKVARLVKLHAIVTDHSPLQVEMFDDRQAAADWLGVPITSLEIR
jgi:hypothetical protein